MAQPERRLAAILAADVVGYSRLMQEDDRAALEALTARRRLFADAVDRRRGRVVNAPGDSILAEFASVVDAVEAALEIQRACAADGQRMQFRIGVNLGDVLVDDAGGIYGDGVNVAARLEALAMPGGVCVSRSVYEQVKSRIAQRFDDQGAKVVKNIASPVHVYAAAGLGRAAPLAAVPATSISIAVLAFDNLSNDPQQEHFCDGICEDIITDLAKINGVAVIGRQSSFAYKGKAHDLRQIGRELGVRFVLEGSVRTAVNRIRVNAQLIEAENGVHVWAQRYDRELQDVFTVGDEVTEEIVTALDVQLAHGEQARIWRKAVRTPEAREAFYRGMNLYYAATPQDIRNARQLFLKTIELEPGAAVGYAQVAVTYCLEVVHGWSSDSVRSIEEARQMAQKACALDAATPAAHAALGLVDLFENRHDDALRRIARALELRPMCANPRAMLGYAQMYAGMFDSAYGNAKEAIALNPVFPVWYHYLMGASQHFGSKHEDSLRTLLNVRAANPRLIPARLALISAQLAVGEPEEAKAEAASVLKDRPDFSLARFAQTQPFRDAQLRERYLDSLREAGLPA